MELRVLRYFWTIAEEENISRAAQLLHITQPTLSRQLMSLEEELGAQLFIRDNHRLMLTQAGYYLKDRAEEILSLTDHTLQQFEDQKKQLFSGTISIGCVEADNSKMLAGMLEHFVSDYPQVKFNLFSGTSDEILERLDKGLLDIGLLLEPFHSGTFERLSFPHREQWGLLVEKRSSLAEKTSIEPADLRFAPLLCSARPDVQQMLGEWAEVPFEQLNVVGTFDLIFNVVAFVENRVGNALTIEGAIASFKDDHVTFVPLNPQIFTNCVAVWKKNRVLSPVANAFLKQMKHACQA